MLRNFALIALLAAAPVAGPAVAVAQSSPSAAQQQAESGKPPQRIRSVTITGNQACPKSSDPDAEIVVCARQGEPYRIPKELRDDKPIAARRLGAVERLWTRLTGDFEFMELCEFSFSGEQLR